MTETRLTYRLRKLTPEERANCCTAVGISETTFYRVCRNPGSMLTLDQAANMTRFLEELDGADYDIYQLLREVDLTA